MHKEKRQWNLKKGLKTIWVSFGIIFTLWLVYSMQSHNVNQNLLQSDKRLCFEDRGNYYSYTPSKAYDEVLIFFPGTLVQPKAYIPLCIKIAENTVKVYLITMPWRQATLGYNKPKELNILNDNSKTYILAGHSKGGKMAVQFVYKTLN